MPVTDSKTKMCDGKPYYTGQLQYCSNNKIICQCLQSENKINGCKNYPDQKCAADNPQTILALAPSGNTCKYAPLAACDKGKLCKCETSKTQDSGNQHCTCQSSSAAALPEDCEKAAAKNAPRTIISAGILRISRRAARPVSAAIARTTPRTASRRASKLPMKNVPRI